ncbi:MAG: hypothetical protein IPN26_10670 [Bacteroidetes bacterium]|nr:hypothetical protein [Bacteroidota bacterium]
MFEFRKRTTHLYVRAKGDKGVWSIIARDTIDIITAYQTATASYPQGNVSVCPSGILFCCTHHPLLGYRKSG